MDLELSPDQRELASVAAQLLDRHAPLGLARAHLDQHGDPTDLWRAVAEVGWYAVGIDDDDPFGLPGLSLLAREWGAHVAPGPLVDTAIAVRLANMLTEPDAAGVDVDGLLAGEQVAALALLEDTAGWDLEGLATTAATDGSDVVIDGVKLGVHHAGRADLLVVFSECAGELAAHLVPVTQEGVEIAADPGLDPSTAPARVTLTAVRVPAAAGISGDDLPRLLAIGAVATAAEGVGAASRALDLAIEYALEREQFGRAIGTFQALQHVMADAHVLRETAWSTVLYASAALDESTSDAEEAVAIAKAYSARASKDVIETACQVFGGVAFTWEHDVHLFQRRVLETERRFGDTIHHERVLGERLAVAGTEVPT